MKALILLLPLLPIMLVQNASAADPVKCVNESCVGAKQAVVANARTGALRTPQPQQIAFTYSDEPLRPAPGMTTWRPQAQKTQKIQKTQDASMQQTFVADTQEFRRM